MVLKSMKATKNNSEFFDMMRRGGWAPRFAQRSPLERGQPAPAAWEARARTTLARAIIRGFV